MGWMIFDLTAVTVVKCHSVFWFCVCLCLIGCFDVFEFPFLVFYSLRSVLLTVLFYCIFRSLVLPVFWSPGCVLQFVSSSCSSMSSFVCVCFTSSLCLPVLHVLPVPCFPDHLPYCFMFTFVPI
ncbi:hypothetical protein XENOCAPTIV_010321 [Xenoophorus captivus]|uniref:Uncharacterized protein n=1 Tax=Xenoophorus captivus TaxID=1517983 RepID=A0ABV0QMS2_9TELE